jgi:hypothetical protein
MILSYITIQISDLIQREETHTNHHVISELDQQIIGITFYMYLQYSIYFVCLRHAMSKFVVTNQYLIYYKIYRESSILLFINIVTMLHNCFLVFRKSWYENLSSYLEPSPPTGLFVIMSHPWIFLPNSSMIWLYLSSSSDNYMYNDNS